MAGKYKDHKKIKRVAFFGDANIPEEDPVYKDAYEIAKLIAQKGYTIVNGGGPGVMNAATSGATPVSESPNAITTDIDTQNPTEMVRSFSACDSELFQTGEWRHAWAIGECSQGCTGFCFTGETYPGLLNEKVLNSLEVRRVSFPRTLGGNAD